MSEPGDLLPLYRDNDHTRVRFIGGPRDGHVATWASGKPPPRIVLPVLQPLVLADVQSGRNVPLRIAAYDPVLDEVGFPRRDDDGTLVYRSTDL